MKGTQECEGVPPPVPFDRTLWTISGLGCGSSACCVRGAMLDFGFMWRGLLIARPAAKRGDGPPEPCSRARHPATPARLEHSTRIDLMLPMLHRSSRLWRRAVKAFRLRLGDQSRAVLVSGHLVTRGALTKRGTPRTGPRGGRSGRLGFGPANGSKEWFWDYSCRSCT